MKERRMFLFLLVVLAVNLMPLIDWVFNSEMTRMQILMKWWYLEAVCLVLTLICLVFFRNKNK